MSIISTSLVTTLFLVGATAGGIFEECSGVTKNPVVKGQTLRPGRGEQQGSFQLRRALVVRTISHREICTPIFILLLKSDFLLVVL